MTRPSALLVLMLLAGSAAHASETTELARQAHEILKKHCHRCHGVDFAVPGLDVLDRDSLLSHSAAGKKPVLTPGKPEESLLWLRAGIRDTMPPRDEQSRPTAQEKETLRKWIEAGAPFPVVVGRRFVPLKELLTAVREDLSKMPREKRPFQRYFTFDHLANNPGVSDAELRLHRAAVAKLVNSLSWKNTLVVPRTVSEVVLAVDVRDLGWDEGDLWRAVLKIYPYGLKFAHHPDDGVRETARDVYSMSRCDLPFVRADWFVAVASRPPLYHTLLRLPATAPELEKVLKVDVRANFLNNRAVRAGFATSGVSAQNRLVERHDAIHGAYWKSYDFRTNDAAGNLFRFPLGPSFADNPHGEHAFRHDGGEIIFHLPNGLQGYLLIDAKDSRIDTAPTEVVSDALKTSGTPAIVNGLSCMACHKHGVIRLKDAVRQGTALAGDPRDKVRLLYPPQEDLDQLLKKDEERFVRALDETVGAFLRVAEDRDRELRDFAEPVGAAARRFLKDVGPAEATAELGLADVKELQLLLKANPRLRELGLGPLQGGSTIKRETWESLRHFVSPFQEAARELGGGTPYRLQ